ncbi:transcription elongation factor Spt5 [Candidatus Woesearchaeota archaeon]|nr:transcription elongation factor Spt5 [Candidatus Woesearchaeota archaeon]
MEQEEKANIFALRTTANREDQVMSFLTSNVVKKGIEVYAVLLPHNMRGYVLLEAKDRAEAERAAFGVPYARGLLKNQIDFHEIEHMVEIVKKEVNIQKNDIVEIVSGPFKREKAKIMRIDKTKDEVIVQLLEAAVAIPITLKTDNVRVIRREDDEEGDEISN